MADVIGGNTQLSATKQDLIASEVQRELAFEAQLVSTVTDVSRFAVKGAASISFPKMTSFSVTNRASAAAGDASVLTAAVDQLDLDINAYIAWLYDQNDVVQSTVEFQLEAARRAAAAHARYVDTQIIAELEAGADATTTAGAITKDIILEMRETLVSQFARRGALTLLVGPDSESVMLGIADFVRADIYGSSNVPDGVIGRVFGVNVRVHEGVGASTYYMYEQGAIALGFQMAPNMSEQMANEYGSGSVRVAMDQKFGLKALQIGQAGATNSALIVKDNN